MKLLDVIMAAGGRVSGGDPYMWQCFGNDAQFMEFRDTDGNGCSHCVFDTKTYEVYEIHCEVPLTTNEAESPEQVFHWINPLFQKAYLNECEMRNINPDIAWDDVRYTPVTDEETILQYVKDIGETYYGDLPLIMEMPGTIGAAKIVFPDETN